MKKLFLSAACIFVAMAVVLGMQSCGTKAIDTKKLEGYWVLDQLNGVSAKEAFKGPIPTLEFNFADTLVAGSAGCNRYFGKFEITNQNVFSASKLASTMMMCAFENKETEFLKAMSSLPVISFDKQGMLTFADNGGNVVLRFAKGDKSSEEKAPVSVTLESLVGKWSMTSLAGKAIKKGERELFIEFAADGTVMGNAGCNNYRSKVELEDNNTLKFAPIASTRMACPELDQETMFLTLLQEPVQVAIEDNVMVLMQNGLTIAEFCK